MSEVKLDRVHLNNGWSFSASPIPEYLDEYAIEEASSIVEKWSRQFAASSTWVSETYGVPSLFVRIDGVYRDKWHIFEIEDRPCGMGAMQSINPHFKSALTEIMTLWPRFSWVQSPSRITDDALWLGKPISLTEALIATTLVLVRAQPHESEYHPLRVRSVSTVSEEGCKQALIDLGYARSVEWCEYLGHPPHDGYIEPALPDVPIVLKPPQGTRGRDVYFHGIDLARHDAPSKRRGDTRGVEGLERIVKRYGKMVIQDFVSPLELAHLGGMNAIHRLYFGYNPKKGKYVPLHGAYAASRSLKVHGDDETVFGPLIMS